MRLFLLPRSMHPARDVANGSFANQSQYKAFSFFEVCVSVEGRVIGMQPSHYLYLCNGRKRFHQMKKEYDRLDLVVGMFTCKMCVVPVFSYCS